MVKSKAATSIEKAGAAQPTTNFPSVTQVNTINVEKTNASTQKRMAELLNLTIIFLIFLMQAPMPSFVALNYIESTLSVNRLALQAVVRS
tara:strand:- start:183 stop:452 length:270 start_codon:yes stop_codon:yes gene_type:complete